VVDPERTYRQPRLPRFVSEFPLPAGTVKHVRKDNGGDRAISASPDEGPEDDQQRAVQTTVDAEVNIPPPVITAGTGTKETPLITGDTARYDGGRDDCATTG
jgi:hypothetical protein